MYIVTGGAGFIGSAMIWRLNEAGIDDILVVDNLASSEKWRNLVNRRYRDYVHRDEFRRMVLEGRAPQKVEAIIHMGACSSTTERNADFLMEMNHVGIPVVLLDRDLRGGGLDGVFLDNFKGSYQATQVLVNQGPTATVRTAFPTAC